MASHTSTITSKGQTTVPEPIRTALGLGVGKLLVWELATDSDGKQSLAVRRCPEIAELAGCLKSEVPFLGIEEEKKAMQQMRAERAIAREQRSLRR
jgi:bifunctional DNA-binding transcriptional regulator/antitoxin component of YhaV-PrlF toxin-antitoxin module